MYYKYKPIAPYPHINCTASLFQQPIDFEQAHKLIELSGENIRLLEALNFARNYIREVMPLNPDKGNPLSTIEAILKGEAFK